MNKIKTLALETLLTIVVTLEALTEAAAILARKAMRVLKEASRKAKALRIRLTNLFR